MQVQYEQGKPLSPRTVQFTAAICSGALRDAMDLGAIAAARVADR